VTVHKARALKVSEGQAVPATTGSLANFLKQARPMHVMRTS